MVVPMIKHCRIVLVNSVPDVCWQPTCASVQDRRPTKARGLLFARSAFGSTKHSCDRGLQTQKTRNTRAINTHRALNAFAN
eukprot:412451-Alexandrium_andersonii.AAC.1